MSFCGSCRAFVRDDATECPECCAPLRKKDRKSMGFDSASERERWLSDRIRTADHECRKFGLEPRKSDESDKDYCQRIDREKTIVMFKPKEREPGSDDDLE